MTEPRPTLARVLWLGALLIRAWTIPLLVLGWFVGTVCMAVVFGFVYAWELHELDSIRRLWHGQSNIRKTQPELADPVDDEDSVDDID